MTPDLPTLVGGHLDRWWDAYRTRIDDLDDDEFLWSPVDGWTVRPVGERWMIDDVDRDADPAPVTSIAWRMWHIAVDCLDSYSRRAFGRQSGPDDLEWVGTADEARARTDAAWTVFRGALAELDAAGWEAPIGGEFSEPYDTSPRLALALHAHAECTHHAAEIALLRDLYRTRWQAD